jgi:hypothetical protein
MLFLHRRWADLPAALEMFARDITPSQENPSNLVPPDGTVWQAHLRLHYTLYQALWQGRAGDDAAAKGLLKQVYLLVDQVAESGMFKKLRRSGGLVQVGAAVVVTLIVA